MPTNGINNEEAPDENLGTGGIRLFLFFPENKRIPEAWSGWSERSEAETKTPQIFFLRVLRGESFLFSLLSVLFLANPASFGYPCRREWLGPGGLPGLQHRWRVALRAAVGSTPIHSRLGYIPLTGEQ
jgi:hypothetical protein